MEGLDIIAFDHNSLERKVDDFKQLDPVIRKNFPEILLATMDTLQKLFAGLKNSAPSFTIDPGREQVI